MSISQSSSAKRRRANAPAKYARDKEFHLSFKNRGYHKQYFKIYSKRLNDLKPRVLESAKKKWDHKKINDVQVHHCPKVLDIQNNEPCWVIGLTYCEMQYKPNVLDDVAIGAYGTLPPAKPSYSDPDSDVLMLEDESGRVQLDGDLIKDSIFVTGNVIGVLGIELEAGQFKVLDVLYPSPAPQIPRPAISEGSKVAIISGLEVGLNHFDPKMALLAEFLSGELGSDDGSANELREVAANVSRLVIAGNSTKTLETLHENSETKHWGTPVKTRYNSTAMGSLDLWIYGLLPSISVDILPGETDPTEVIFPQQPLHSAFFKKSKKFLDPERATSFRALTNPAWIEIDGIRILGTGGQNINDMYKYLVPYYEQNDDSQGKLELRTELMEATINWQNIIPSSPDTLWTYPFDDRDPFTLDETPHVYFVGCQPRYESRMMSLKNSKLEMKVRLISIPHFSETGEIVLLDTKTLETSLVKLSV